MSFVQNLCFVVQIKKFQIVLTLSNIIIIRFQENRSEGAKVNNESPMDGWICVYIYNVHMCTKPRFKFVKNIISSIYGLNIEDTHELKIGNLFVWGHTHQPTLKPVYLWICNNIYIWQMLHLRQMPLLHLFLNLHF